MSGVGWRRFPSWGTADELIALMDSEWVSGNRFVAPARPIVGSTDGDLLPRNVVEGGQLVGAAIVAAAKHVPDQRVTQASATFVRAATFDHPLDVDVETLHRGRTFSTLLIRMAQQDQLRCAVTVLLDAGADDLIRHDVAMPDVPPPDECPRLDMGVEGRELRHVDGAYDPDPDRVGPPRLDVWCRFAVAPDQPWLAQALLAQASTHWTIAAALRPHAGHGEAQAHETLSTGPVTCTIAFHADPDVSRWFLYDTVATHAGRGMVHGEGRIFASDARLLASTAVDAMVRPLVTAGGRDPATVM